MIDTWPALPTAVRQGLLTIIDAVGGHLGEVPNSPGNFATKIRELTVGLIRYLKGKRGVYTPNNASK